MTKTPFPLPAQKRNLFRLLYAMPISQILKKSSLLYISVRETVIFFVGKSLSSDAEELAGENEKIYKKYGYGNLIHNRAFLYERDQILPVKNPSDIRLSNLKNYTEEKKIIAENIENFLNGLPFADILLYGERGTGKSSTVLAMLNEYFDSGLRLVELNKENMLSLSKIKEKLNVYPLKFIIYIDDLSLRAGDERISFLKAALEGGSAGNTKNSMIVATSNRRHIVDEKFSDREDSVHAGDSTQEDLSLSDRFGLSVLFSSVDKTQYLSIVKQLADEKGISLPEEKLYAAAECWATRKGGRSPRRAKQFIDALYASYIKEIPFSFL